MSDLPNITVMHGGDEVEAVHYMGQEAEYVIVDGKMVFQREKHYSLMDFSFQPQSRLTDDAEARWFEFGFNSWGTLTGNSTTGFYTPNGLKITLESSTDLVVWNLARFIDCVGSPTDNGDGTFTYWSRCIQPNFYFNVLADFSLICNRYGKSLESLNLMGTDLALPHFPYALPADAAVLQADLVALGYTGATVRSTSAPITASGIEHESGINLVIRLTVSSGQVTEAKNVAGVHISLPGYPYALPSDVATLQADLRSNGFPGAVVKMWGDEWTITMPNVSTPDNQRFFSGTISPGDPYPYWDAFGVYQGLNSDTYVSGLPSNVRDLDGNPLEENLAKNFARLRISLP